MNSGIVRAPGGVPQRRGSASVKREGVEIWFPVKRDEKGYPKQPWEQLYAWPVGDVVAARPRETGWYQFDHVVRANGHSTFRIWLAQKASAAPTVIEKIRQMGCQAELTLNRLIAIDAPPAQEPALWEYLQRGMTRGDWDLQVGCSRRDQ